MHNTMAWRPYANLIDGELDNRIPGKVTGWMRFFRPGKRPLKVIFDLSGDFHEDIRGKMIRLSNPDPAEQAHGGEGSMMDGFCRVQRGTTGDITSGISLGPWTKAVAEKLMAQNELIWDDGGLSGIERERERRKYANLYRKHIKAGDLFRPYVDYPYIEWYSDNGRVVLELDPSQLEIVGGVPVGEKSARELLADKKRRTAATGEFLGTMMHEFSRQNHDADGDTASSSQ
jgi:hypothetical protein